MKAEDRRRAGTRRMIAVLIEGLSPSIQRLRMQVSEETFASETWLHIRTDAVQIDVMFCLPGLPVVEVTFPQPTPGVHLTYSGRLDRSASTLSRRYYRLVEGRKSRSKGVTEKLDELADAYVKRQAEALSDLLDASPELDGIRVCSPWVGPRVTRKPRQV